MRKKAKGTVDQAAVEAAIKTLESQGVDNPFLEDSDLEEAWDKTKKQHLAATMKISSPSQGQRLQALMRTKIKGLMQHCNADGASNLRIEMQNMLRRTYG
jgi:hypothetical protein|tara:strand:+ start:116 stop:415 length:300 start_codon:yes stop_codon:yes gene_type:complete